MYKPGNLSAPPPVVTPHQPRLDWQMWFAALGPHTQAPWFTSLMYSLLQGKKDGTHPREATAVLPCFILRLKPFPSSINSRPY